MRNRPAHCLLLVSLVSLGPARTALAQAAPEKAAGAEPAEVTQARAHFSQGLKLYKDGDFDAALVQFERAYAAKPNYKVLYNIAQANFELRQYVEARDALKRYLAEGAEGVDSERRQSVTRDLADLERRIARVKLEVNLIGATVFVDGKKVGTTPLADLLDVSEGQRTISVESPERGTKQRLLRVAGGEEQTVQIEFATSTASSVPLAEVKSPPQPEGSRQLGAGFWVTAAGAVALGAGAGVTGYLALKEQAKYEDELDRFGVKQSELKDVADRAKKLALATDILAGSAIVCAGVAVVLFATSSREREPRLALSVGPASASLRGSF